MADGLVDLTVADGVARVVLNRPAKRNALNRELMAQLSEAVAQVAGDESVRLMALAAEGTVFCAGMDLAEMESRADDPEGSQLWQEDTRVYRDLLFAITTLRVPTLAVVQGPALAGGLGLVLACDLVIASRSAYFSLPEPKRGISAAVVTPLLVYRVGTSVSSRLLLSGQRLSAIEAAHVGLSHALVYDEELAATEAEWTRSILTGSREALAVTKQSLLDCAGPSLVNQLEAAMQVSAKARETEDAREGLAAFLEKREPHWTPSAD